MPPTLAMLGTASTSSATTTSIWTAGDTVTPQPSELEARDKIELTDLVRLETAATGSQVITPVSHFYKAIFYGEEKSIYNESPSLPVRPPEVWCLIGMFWGSKYLFRRCLEA